MGDCTRSGSAVFAKPAAILVPCSSLKSQRPDREAQAISLPIGSQSEVETAWLQTLTHLKRSNRADNLYRGRGFRLAHRLAAECESQFYVVSAGLGLVKASTSIPTYGLGLTKTGPESIASRISGRLDLSGWWRAVNSGPYAIPIHTAMKTRGTGVVVATLSHSYARLVGPALAELPNADLNRLRIIGVGLRGALPETLWPYIMPYDDRVNAHAPGARVDLAQRALTHFVRVCLRALPDGDATAHANWIAAALEELAVPVTPARRRCSDDAVLKIIDQHLGSGISATRLLRVLRDREGVACEQSRFARLYRMATARRAA